MTDVRKTIAEQIGQLVLTNIELVDKLGTAQAEIERLRPKKPKPKKPKE